MQSSILTIVLLVVSMSIIDSVISSSENVEDLCGLLSTTWIDYELCDKGCCGKLSPIVYIVGCCVILTFIVFCGVCCKSKQEPQTTIHIIEREQQKPITPGSENHWADSLKSGWGL